MYACWRTYISEFICIIYPLIESQERTRDNRTPGERASSECRLPTRRIGHEYRTERPTASDWMAAGLANRFGWESLTAAGWLFLFAAQIAGVNCIYAFVGVGVGLGLGHAILSLDVDLQPQKEPASLERMDRVHFPRETSMGLGHGDGCRRRSIRAERRDPQYYLLIPRALFPISSFSPFPARIPV